MNIIIVGSGAVAAELTSYLEDQNRQSSQKEQFSILGYLDEPENVEKYWSKYSLKKPVLANVSSYEIQTGDHFLVGISDLKFRRRMIDILKTKGAKIIGFVHHSAIIAESARIGEGNIIYPHCIIGPNSSMDDHNFVTSYSFISHDCAVGSGNFFSSAGLGGRVSIGDNNFFGIRATVIPNVCIGSNNVIQAGMTVDKNIEDDATVFYRFKEKIIAIPKN